ncbi:hypothetical protein OIE13_13545 [Streptosporangium sp. NBC_01810]|uniref:DUF6603 domain-containing protein n=1 Tax=Streptosporangium sp. NBC_01810 TaxID=2975951 RepID=UPI002DDA8683|nr:DUF6603 domain-containing protein [Streptosporangium sp. NBC_01810]WSA28805.1 hypothetical protein OIE13_13545 [Streptosporangium sp. NBC_01810]
MSVSAGVFAPELAQLGVTLGVLLPRADGGFDFNDAFFADPIGALRGVVSDPVRLDALLSLLDFGDGPPTVGERTRIRLQRFGAASIYLTIDRTAGGVDLGVAGTAAYQKGGVGLAGEVWLPLLRIGEGMPPRLLPGGPDGPLGVRFTVLSPAGGSVSIGSVAGEFHCPTDGGDPGFGLDVRGLQLPGWPQARDLTLTGGQNFLADELPELLSLLLDLASAAAGLDPATARHLSLLLTLIGLGDEGRVPRLRLDDVAARGGVALRDWALTVLADSATQGAWLLVLAELAGVPGEVAGSGPDGLRVRLTGPGTTVVYATLAVTAGEIGTRVLFGIAAETEAPPLGEVPVTARLGCQLLRLEFTPGPAARWLPWLRAEVVCGTPGRPLSAPLVGVLRLGLSLTEAHGLVPIAEAVDVRVGDGVYPVLDLTSVDAVTQIAGDAAVAGLAGLLEPLFGDEAAARVRALMVLLGLREPGVRPEGWPELPVAAAFFADPLVAVAFYHAAALGAGGYRVMIDAARTLFAVSSDLAGSGTSAEPWATAFGSPVPDARLELLIWGDGGAAAPVLTIAARVVLGPRELVDGTLVSVIGLHELARVALPVEHGRSPAFAFCERHEISLALEAGYPIGTFLDEPEPDEPESEPDGPESDEPEPDAPEEMEKPATGVESPLDDHLPPARLELRAGPVTASCRSLQGLVWWRRDTGWGGNVHVHDAALDVAGVHLEPPTPFSLDWPDGDLDLELAWPLIRPLLGLRLALPRLDLPEPPHLSLPELLAAMLGWLPTLRPFALRLPELGDSEFDWPRFDLPDFGGDWPVLSLPKLVVDPLGALRLWLGDLFGGPLALPAVSLTALLTGLPELTGSGRYDDPWAIRLGPDGPEALIWLDPDGPTLSGLDEVFAELVPADLRTAHLDPAELLDALDAVSGLDTHLGDLLAGRADLAASLATLTAAFQEGDGLLPASAQAGPADRRSPITATHLDAPARFHLGDHSTAQQERTVYLCAPLPGVRPWPGQEAGTIIDLTTPTAVVASERGPWFVLMPPRTAGGHAEAVERLRTVIEKVTVASGGAPVVVAHSVTAYPARALHREHPFAELITVCGPHASPPLTGGGDAARFLDGLAARLPVIPDALRHMLATLDDGLPLAEFTPPPTAPGDEPAAPDGEPAAPDGEPAAPDGEPAVTAVIATLPDAGQILADLVADVIAAGPPGGANRRPVTHLGLGLRVTLPQDGTVPGEVAVTTSLRADLHQIRLRDGDVRPCPRLRTQTIVERPGGWLLEGPARFRRAEIWLDAAGPAGAVEVVLHDAALPGSPLGRHRVTRETLDAGGRTLLGELGRELAGTPLAGTLRALGLARADLTLDADAIERLFWDPRRYLSDRVADQMPAADLGGGLRLEADFGAGTVVLVIGTPVVLAGVVGLSGAVTVTLADPSAATGRFTLTAGDLVVTCDEDGVRVGEAALLPSPDVAGLTVQAAELALGQLLRMLIQAVVAEAPRVSAVLKTIGLLDEHGAARDPLGLLTAPGRWFTRPESLGSADGLGGISPAKLTTLLTAIAELVTDEDAGTGLPLPMGGRVTATADGDDVLLTLAFLRGVGATIRIGPAPKVTLNAVARVSAPPDLTGISLAAAEVELNGERVTLRLWRDPALPPTVVRLTPDPSGLGELAALAAEAATEYVLPLLLDELADLGGAAAALGAAITGVGGALALVDQAGRFDIVQLRTLAADPGAELARRFRAAPAAVVRALVNAATPAGPPAPDAPPDQLWAGAHVRLLLNADPDGVPELTVVLAGMRPLNGVALDGRISAGPGGLGPTRLTLTAIPPDLAAPDPVVLLRTAWPYLELRAGGDTPGLHCGLWLDRPGTPEADALTVVVPPGGPPGLWHRGGETFDGDLAAAFAEFVLDVMAPLVLDPVLALDGTRALLRDTTIGGTALGEILVNAGLLTPAAPAHQLDTRALADPLDTLIRAVVALLDVALAEAPTSPLRLRLIGEQAGDGRRYLLGLALPQPLPLPAAGPVTFALRAGEEDEPVIQIGLVEIGTDVTFTPGLRVRGLGFTATGTDGPLVPGPVRVEAITLYGTYEHATTGFVEGGARLEITGLELPIGESAGGDNPVAAKVLRPGEEGGPAPGLSPYVEIHKTGAQNAEFRLGVAGDGWVPIRRSFGPVYIEQIGYDLTDPAAFVLLVDGGVELGPLHAQIDELAVIIPLATPANPLAWRLDLAGLAVSFDGDGVSIAGGLRRMRRDGGVEYIGMLEVKAGGYGLTAMGSYGMFPIPNQPEKYASLFVVAALLAPLGGPPAFFLLGLGGGIGLNRELRAPDDMTKVKDFPLIAALRPDSAPARDPMAVLGQLGQTFPPRHGAFWLAAGVRFTSFTLVESIAVLTVAIGDGLEIMVLGLARAGLPNPDAPAVYLELALCARFSTSEGVLSVQAQLTDNSWVINPSCRVFGGFAFVIWFRTGEFLVSIGGYHPRFKRAPHHPAVPRVGFAWSVSEAIMIKGEAYFTLTSTCVMTGGRLEAAADFGFAGAWFAVGLDILISWDPFFYDFSVYVSVGVWILIEVKIWFIHISLRLSLSIGVELLITGPELRGLAKLDLGVAVVTVPFGAAADTAPKAWLGWAAFHDKYLVAGDPSKRPMSMGVTRGAHTDDPGAPPPEAGSPPERTRVLPEFSLRTAVRAAGEVNGARLPGPALSAAPMGRATVVARHRVTIRDSAGSVTPGTWTPVRGQVPEAVWGMPRPNGAGGMREAYVGADFVADVTITGTTPQISVHQIEVSEPLPLPLPLPLLDDRDPDGELSAADEAAAAWAASVAGADAFELAGWFMANATQALARCLGPRAVAATAAGPSAFERALLGGERSAAPRPARITAGVFTPARLYEPAVIRELPVRPEPTPPPVPVPVLLAVLRPEARPARRQRPRTSVGKWGDSYPRTSPPTVASVSARHPAVAAALITTDPVDTKLLPQGDRRTHAAPGGAIEVVRGLFSYERLAHDPSFGVRLPAGDVQVWHVPGAHDDWADARPWLEVGGRQLVRVCVLDLAGRVLADVTMSHGTIPVPVGAHRVVVVGSGFEHDLGGLSGWHSGVPVARVGEHACVVAGGVLRTPGATTRRARRPTDIALADPADIVRGQGLSETTLPRSRSVVITLRPLTPPPGELLIGLDGAKWTGAPDRLFTFGEEIVMLREVLPGSSGCTVSVAHDGSFALRAVLGSPDPAGVLAARLMAAEGDPGLAGRLPGLVTGPVAGPVQNSTITWRPAT